jgi:hypothetical protein
VDDKIQLNVTKVKVQPFLPLVPEFGSGKDGGILLLVD